MSHYSCPTCSEPTSVIETRVSRKRLRRRRSCQHGHRFTTVELPHELPKQLKDLVKWLVKQGLDPEIASYANEELKSLIFGSEAEEETPDTTGLEATVRSPFASDEGHRHEILGLSPASASEVPNWTGSTLLQGGAETSTFESPGSGEARA